MKRALTIFGAILVLGLISWACNGQAGFNNADGAGIKHLYQNSGFANTTVKHIIMILVGLGFILLAIRYSFEPLLLVPIGMGILIGNIPFMLNNGLGISIYEQGSVLNYLYLGITAGVYPSLIFLGLGAMTDFSSLISNPKLLLIGAACQIGIFLTFIGALYLGFTPPEAASVGMIGGADGPTAIFTVSKLANGIRMWNGSQTANLIAPVALAAYACMALVPVVQPPIMRLLTTKKERKIKMKALRQVTKLEKILFPVIGLLLTGFIVPVALPLLGMLFLGNILRESGVTKRLAETARTSMVDIVTILIGVTVGAATQAEVILTGKSLTIFGLGAVSVIFATMGGILFAKFMNLFLKPDNRINPLIGAAGVSAVADSARVAQAEGLRADPANHLLMHAMGPNVAGIIGSAVAAGIMLGFLI